MIYIDIFNPDPLNLRSFTYKEEVTLFTSYNSYKDVSNKIDPLNNSILFSNVTFEKDVYIQVDPEIKILVSIAFIQCLLKGHIKSSSILLEKHKLIDLLILKSFFNTLRCNDDHFRSVRIINSFGNFDVSGIDTLEYKLDLINNNLPNYDLKNTKSRLNIRDVKNIFIQNQIKEDESIKNLILADDYFSALDLHVNINNSISDNTKRILIQNFEITNLTLTGTTTASIEIENCQISQIRLNVFYPKNNFSLYNLKPNQDAALKLFIITKSNLDNAWFNSVNLSEYNLIFENSSFINTKFTSTIFPNIKDLLDTNTIYRSKANLNEETYNRNMYELFLELKLALEKRGNKIEALKMNSVAYSYLNKINGSDHSFFNKNIILWLNKLSNNHGVSIKRPLFWILISVTILHTLNILSFKSVALGFNDWPEFKRIICDNLKHIFTIANPTHKISSFGPENNLTFCTYAISFLSRIIIGYLYYQFIAAFRRFGK